MIHSKRAFRNVSSVFMFVFLCLFTSPAAFADIAQLDFDEMVHTADIIFVGTVSDQTCRVGENRVTLFTDVSFSNIDMIHKKPTVDLTAGDAVSLTYAGGQLGEVFQRVSDMPSFEEGQRYLVFAYYDGRPYANPLVGGNQGLFKITSDETTGRKYPIRLSGRGIAGIKNNRFSFAPRLKTIIKGILEFAETESDIKIAPPPGSPAAWPYPAKTRKTSLPSKILSLNELTAKIDNVLAQQPSPGIAAKLAARAASEPMKTRSAADFNDLDRAWEFSDDGKLIVLDETRVKCRSPKAKTGNAAAMQKSSFTGATQPLGKVSNGDVIVSGWMDLPLVMELTSESSPTHDEEIRGLNMYNRYIDGMGEFREKDGGWYINGWSEFCGIITSSEMYDAYLATWSGQLGRTIYTGGTCDDCEIYEADIMFNAAINWTFDPVCMFYHDDPVAYGGICEGAIHFQKTLLHEIGHAFGLMLDGDWEDYKYDVPTVMNGGLESTIENSRGLHVADANLLRRWYKDQRSGSDMDGNDIGVESWYASGGAWNSLTTKAYSTPPGQAPKYAPGETIELENITIENIGRNDAPNVRLRAYLDSSMDLLSLLDEVNYQDLSKIPAGRLLTGPSPGDYYQWDTLGGAEYWTGNVTFTVPETIPSGKYRVHLVVTANNDEQRGDDNFWENITAHNNHTFLHDEIEVVCPVPAAPANFRVLSADENGVTLGWDAVENARYYQLMRGSSGSLTTAPILGSTIYTTFTDTTAQPGKIYYYWLKVQNTCDTWSDKTPAGEGISGMRRLTPPCIQKATEGDYTDRIEITTLRVDGADQYSFFISASNDPATAYRVTPWSPDSTVHTGGVPGKTYYYWAMAMASEIGPDSATELGLCPKTGWRKLSPPENVTATTDSTTNVQVSWSTTPGATHYRLYRNTENNPDGAVPLFDWWHERTYYSDSDVATGQQYYYWVRAAVDSQGNRPSDLSLAAFGWEDYEPVGNVILADGASDGDYTDKVQITWNAVSYPVADYYYRVYRSESDVPGTAVPITGWLSSGIRACNDTTAVPGKLYWYWVSAALSAAGERESFWQGCSTCVDSGYRQLLSASVITASNNLADRIGVTWKPVTGATHYKVYRSTTTDSSTAVLISPVIAQVTFDDNDTSLAAGTPYYYWVTSAADETGSRESALSNASYDEGRKAFPPPTAVTASDGTYDDKVRVSWGSVAGASHYRLYRYTSNNPASALAQGGWMTATTYDDTSAVRGQTYYYWVQAATSQDGDEATGMSRPDTGWRLLNSTAKVTASDGTYTDRVSITWNSVPDATHYRVYRSTKLFDPKNPLPPFPQPISDWLTGYSFDDTSAGVGTIYYYYVVSACSDTGENESLLSTHDSGFRALAPPNLTYVSQGQFREFVSLKWEKGASESTHYRVYRSRFNIPIDLEVLAVSGWLTELLFEDRDVLPGDKFYYWVKAATDAEGANASAWSNSGNGELGYLAATAGCDDPDRDGICSTEDNCPNLANPGQEDNDTDGFGDWCDTCPKRANADQLDSDQDGLGDACDNCPNNQIPDQTDMDGDGVGDACDNCPDVSNADQADRDSNGVGDACDSNPDNDLDDDGVNDDTDNCPNLENAGQEDNDTDGIGDVCDNCPKVANADQADKDSNGVGDACENPSQTCGNGILEGSEECEADTDCTTGSTCNECKCFSPTFAKEIIFNAKPGNDEVVLSWTAVSEVAVLGYNILRADGAQGDFVQINNNLIAAKGSPETTVEYDFTDANVQNRKYYRYKLIEVQTDGSAKEHGPAGAMPLLLHDVLQ